MDKLAIYWENMHRRYGYQYWIDKPTIFAKWAKKYFPQQGNILELGAGHGQDSRYFATQGYQVVSTDFSDAALKHSRTKTPDELKELIEIKKLDLSQKFPFKDNTFDIVYSHLSVHYFSEKVTKQLFSEILRILKPGGIVAILVNSTTDKEYGKKPRVEEDFFDFGDDFYRRFFSIQSLEKFAQDFKIIVLDDKGETYKDNVLGVLNLIRLIAQKNL